MDIDLVEKISNLAFAGYYNPDLDMVVIHFFNKNSNKNDIIAYLRHNLNWDVREIVDEVTELDALAPQFIGENITITHEAVGTYQPQSNFDVFIRNAIKEMYNNDDDDIQMVDTEVINILENGYGKRNTDASFSKNKKLLN